VTVTTASQKSIPLELRLIGNVEASASIAVKPQVTGEVTRVYFSEGQDVVKGALLFQIDPRPYEQALRQAEANLARDQAQTRQAEANLARDQAQVKTADLQAQRYAQLARDGIISKEQNEMARATADNLQETIRADQAAVESARASLIADRAAIDKARLDLTYCTLRAPISGSTGNLSVRQGNLVKANADAPLVTINQTAPVNIAFSVPETHLNSIRRQVSEGQQLAVRAILPDKGGMETGVLSFIDNAIDNTKGAIRLKASFPNPERKLWPGQLVSVTFTLNARTNVVVVPPKAVQNGPKGQSALVVKADNTVENRDVEVGRPLGRELIITSGLAAGERVIMDRPPGLADGATVQIASQEKP
jgi:multidrug efflux system membrane fusion protein